MHHVRIVQSLHLPTLEEWQRALQAAGYNTFLLHARDLFLDMLTDSGVNAMSDHQLAGTMEADDAYAGSENYYHIMGASGTCSVFVMSFPRIKVKRPNIWWIKLCSSLELTRIALPRRTFTLSHLEYTVDRVQWLYRRRDLVGGLCFVEEPSVLRFFFG